MDEGVAALIAGLAGMAGALGGAVAGGMAAVRGAKIGAENAADVARQQTKDQATVEHQHWIREQRQQAYVAFMAAALKCELECHNIREALSNSRNSIETEPLESALTEVTETAPRILLLGPDRMIELAHSATQAAIDALELVESHEGTDHDRVSEALERISEANVDFYDSARRIMQEIHQ
jgi:hypothetical protein